MKIKSKPVTTVLVISMGFLAFYLKTKVHWLLIASFITGLTGILSPFMAKWIDYGWMKLTKLLSFIVPNILLSIVFFVFLFPIALISRLFTKKDTLKLSPNQSSTFVVVEGPFKKENFEKSW